MFNFLKSLFVKKPKEVLKKITKKTVMFNDSVLESLRLNYIFNVANFEKEWISGSGKGDYKKGDHFQWYSPMSVTLDEDEILLTSTYSPNTIEGDRYEYRVGMVTSSRLFYQGYYEFNVWLPEGKFLEPSIELIGDGNITLLKGYSDDDGEYLRFETIVFGEDKPSDVILKSGEYNKIGCLYLGDSVEIYYNDILVRKETSTKNIIGNDIKVSIKNSHRPMVEAVKIIDDTVMKLIGLKYYRKK